MSTVTYNQRQYILTFQEYHSILLGSFWAAPRFFETYKRITGTDVGFLYIIKNNELIGFMETNGPENIYASIKNKLTKEWITTEIKRFDGLVHQLQKIIEPSRKEFHPSGFEERLKTVFSLLMQIYPYSNSFYLLSQILESQLMKKLTEKYGSERANTILIESGTPLKDTLLVQYRKEIESIAAELNKKGVQSNLLQTLYKKDPSFANKINDIQEKYFCLTSINAEERTPESFFPDIVQAMTNFPSKKEKTTIPSEVEEDIFLLRAMVYFKDEISTYLIPYVKFGLNLEWNALAAKWDLTREEMDHLLIEEVLGLTPIKNVKKLVSERRKGVLFIHEPPKSSSDVLDGNKAEIEIQIIMNQMGHAKVDVTEINGSIGSPGKVRGIVHKILSSKEISKFEKGKILVTVYTAPDFVPATLKSISP